MEQLVLREAAFQQCSPQGRKDQDAEENACVPHGRAVVPAAVAVTDGVPETNPCISFSSTKELLAKQQEAPLEVMLLRPRLNWLAGCAGLSSQGDSLRNSRSTDWSLSESDHTLVLSALPLD